jgi:transcriptional regulator with XRE-family HTH domain
MPQVQNQLGAYLRDRRTRLDPAAFGISGGRRRTPGLRREEVALRANISPTWYTWLEQGRGGAPSADVLDRIAKGLMLTEPEREHLFLLGLGRPPEVRYKSTDTVTPRLQRVLDAFEISPAIIKNLTWDVIAWNRAAAVLFTDYAKVPREQRNILRLMFGSQRTRNVQHEWESVARAVVAGFRIDVARAGATEQVSQLIDELSAISPEFSAYWRDNEVIAHTEGVKRLNHPQGGLLELEFSSFAVEGRPELSMIVYNPVAAADADRVRALVEEKQD